MLSEQRKKFKKLERIIGKFFAKKIGLSPNQYTLLAVFLALVCLYFLTRLSLAGALVFFVLAALLDIVDGAVARYSRKTSKEGAYLDTVCDRYVEGIILLGFLSLPLSPLFLPAKFWIFIAFLGSLMTTYSKAAAKEKELVKKELNKGFLGRGERMILISSAMVLGLFNFSWIIYPIVILAVLSNLTALQRIFLSLGPGKS